MAMKPHACPFTDSIKKCWESCSTCKRFSNEHDRVIVDGNSRAYQFTMNDRLPILRSYF